jgi:hypothetical protein
MQEGNRSTWMMVAFVVIAIAIAAMTIGRTISANQPHNLGPLGGGGPAGGMKKDLTPSAQTDTPAKSGASGQ